MNRKQELSFDRQYSDLPNDPAERHEAFVDFFGRFLFWIRNWAVDASHTLVESEGTREKLANLRRAPYDAVAQMSPKERQAAISLAEETLNGFGERLVWFLGGSGTDLQFGAHHAYRFKVVMEIADRETGEVVEEVVVNRGGRKFFGNYWGRWVNRFAKS